MLSSRPNTIQIRFKPSHQRSSEEKRWVALDILVNRNLYDGLSTFEKEEMQLNDEYKTGLQPDDVRRILSLPHEIQLALPRLDCPEEIDAHRLLVMHTFEHGGQGFAEADNSSQAHFFGQTLDGEQLHTERTEQPQKLERIALFDSMSDVGMRPMSAKAGKMAVRMGEREVYRSGSSILGRREARIHTFPINDAEPRYSVDLKVSKKVFIATKLDVSK